MHDRGEKIVNLARELLRSEQSPAPERPTARNTLSLRVLCFATFLAALGGSGVTQLINETRRPINRYEMVELDALVFYASRLKGISEDTLRREVEAQAGGIGFSHFTQNDYRLARTYLQNKI